jgi:hypothetical protein
MTGDYPGGVIFFSIIKADSGASSASRLSLILSA